MVGSAVQVLSACSTGRTVANGTIKGLALSLLHPEACVAARTMVLDFSVLLLFTTLASRSSVARLTGDRYAFEL